MGLTHGPRTVTDGLALCLDAANSRSYPGTGTTWTDLKGGNNATLNNGPTFDSANGGSIITDGTDDYIDTGYHISKSDTTIETVFKCNLISGAPETVYAQNNITFTQGFGLFVYTGGLLAFVHATGASPATTVITSIDSNKIYHITICTDFTNNSSFKLMVNGSIVAPDNTPDVAAVMINTSSSVNVFLGSSRLSSYYANNNFYYFKVYDRLLLEEEMLQNYNATRHRFGV